MKADKILDCKELSCPMPIIKLSKAMKELQVGQVLEMTASDPGSKSDVPAWCQKTGNDLIELIEDSGEIKFYIKKN